MTNQQAKLQKLCESINGFTASIMLPDYENNVLRSTICYNLPADWAALTNPFDGTTDNGNSFVNDVTVIKNGLQQKTLRTAETMHPIESVIVVPIKKSEKVIGTLVVLGDDPNTTFGKEDLAIMQRYA